MRRIVSLLAVLAALALVQGSAAASPRGTFVGKVAGSRAYVAVLSNGRRVAGYVCDGRHVSVWLAGTRLTGGRAPLVSRRGARLGFVELSAAGASGRILVGGRRLRFSAARARGRAGLYRAAMGKPGKRGFVEAGWIVLADGSQRGAVNSFIDPGVELAVDPAPKLGPGQTAVAIPDVGTLAAHLLTPGFIDPNVGL